MCTKQNHRGATVDATVTTYTGQARRAPLRSHAANAIDPSHRAMTTAPKRSAGVSSLGSPAIRSD